MKPRHVLITNTSLVDTVHIFNETYQLLLENTGRVKQLKNTIYYIYDAPQQPQELAHVIERLAQNRSSYQLKRNTEVYTALNFEYLERDVQLSFIKQEANSLFLKTEYYN